MAKVLGLGGGFFKAADPKGVRERYARVLGFDVTEWGGVMWSHPSIGKVNWSVFPDSTDYLAPSKAAFMVNFIVDDLDGVLAKAASEGAEALGREDTEYGRFGWLLDPAG